MLADVDLIGRQVETLDLFRVHALIDVDGEGPQEEGFCGLPDRGRHQLLYGG